jgi:D-alanyl-D-alanine carboxypeptidase
MVLSNLKKPLKGTEVFADDIPEAVRDDYQDVPARSGKSPTSPANNLTWRLMGWGVIALITTVGLYWQFGLLGGNAALTDKLVVLSPSPSLEPSVAPTVATTSDIPEENVLGHLPYEEAPTTELKTLAGSDVQMRYTAAKKFEEMANAAVADGITLVPLSGHRTIQEQEYLFFEVKEERVQVASKRAEVSAPPGYSEHHTGYAIDIGDANTPHTNLNVSFEDTAAFAWLQANAPRFSFELSFTKDNLQGISYEPWHWRFVGDRDSLETFYRAKSLQKITQENSDSITQPSSQP